MFNRNRSIDYSYMGGTKKMVSNLVNGVQVESYETSSDHRTLHIYCIEQHNVDIKSLSRDLLYEDKDKFQVTFMMRHTTEHVIEGYLLSATKDFRTLCFTNESHSEGKTIGIPIMNIVSIKRMK